MAFKRVVSLALLATGALALSGRAEGPAVDYARDIKPLLKQRCYACHGALKQKARLRLDTVAAMREGGDSGAAIEPGSASDSLILDRVAETDAALRMPPEGQPLTDEQIDRLRRWIDQGAAAPSGEAPEPDPRRHWAFVPPVRPPVPDLGERAPVRNPIDAFLARDWAARGLTPLPQAEPEVLLRRLSFDLIGLPPTRDELRAFLDDPSEAAYRRAVERLLASPRHGERWARHWMDVWRYSDWYGRRTVPDVLNSYAMIWRWRDWIVRSLNEGKPYDVMVRQMLAADEMGPLDQRNVVATGFLVRNFYRWNYNSWMKDNVEHVGKAFLGLTLNCAHCHDHKYDPITHEDYFAFRAFFEPLEIRHDRVPGEPDPGPYTDYVYGSAYKPITSGLVRVFDRKLDAQTFLYTRGESRNIVKERGPIAPCVPAFLKPPDFHIEPVPLPREAAHPGLLAFVRDDERARARSARETALASWKQAAADLTAARAARDRLTHERMRTEPIAFVLEDRTIFAFAREDAVPAAHAKALHEAEHARLAHDRASRALVLALAQAEALEARIIADEAAVSTAQPDATALNRMAWDAERRTGLATAELALAQAALERFEARSKPDAEQAKAETKVAAARKAIEAARAAATQPAGEHTALGPHYNASSTGRRTALARWITDRKNPLTARVAVNHVWAWHFHNPIVATTADFGRNGKPPTHPELLDWLAVEFMESGWDLKHLHRLIVTSDAYRMRSHDATPSSTSSDPETPGFARFEPARIEAEVVRDSLLYLTGNLDERLGGPDIDFKEGLKIGRRSLYFTHHAEARMPFLELFDAPDACDAYKRTTSVVPQQALALTNNESLLEWSEGLRERLGPLPREDFLRAAFETILGRPPSRRETELSSRFLDRQAALAPDANDPEARARRDLIHALFSHNDFVIIH